MLASLLTDSCQDRFFMLPCLEQFQEKCVAVFRPELREK
jgi:hypothetical protein